MLNCCTVVAICDLVQDVEQILVLIGMCQFLVIGYWLYFTFFCTPDIIYLLTSRPYTPITFVRLHKTGELINTFRITIELSKAFIPFELYLRTFETNQ